MNITRKRNEVTVGELNPGDVFVDPDDDRIFIVIDSNPHLDDSGNEVYAVSLVTGRLIMYSKDDPCKRTTLEVKEL